MKKRIAAALAAAVMMAGAAPAFAHHGGCHSGAGCHSDAGRRCEGYTLYTSVPCELNCWGQCVNGIHEGCLYGC